MKEACSKYKVEINEIGKKETKRKSMKLKICSLKTIKTVFIYDLKKNHTMITKQTEKQKYVWLIWKEGNSYLIYQIFSHINLGDPENIPFKIRKKIRRSSPLNLFCIGLKILASITRKEKDYKYEDLRMQIKLSLFENHMIIYIDNPKKFIV